MLIADHHPIVRCGLRQVIGSTADIVVQDEAADGQNTLAKLRADMPDVLVLEPSIPGISGTDLIRRIRVDHATLPILIFNTHTETHFASRALRAGVSGYLTKDIEPSMLLAGIRRVHAGGRFIDPSLVDRLLFRTDLSDVAPHQLLSDREFQVLQQLAYGRTVNEIAGSYSLSAKTISTHKARLMKKLSISNNSELIRYAMTHGIVQSNESLV